MSPNPKGLLAAVPGEFWAPHRKPGPGAAHICTGLADRGEELCQQPGMMLGPETAEQQEGVVRANPEGKAWGGGGRHLVAEDCTSEVQEERYREEGFPVTGCSRRL